MPIRKGTGRATGAASPVAGRAAVRVGGRVWRAASRALLPLKIKTHTHKRVGYAPSDQP